MIGHEPYLPSCMIQKKRKIFQKFNIPPLSYRAYCTIEKYPIQVQAHMIEKFNGSMLLPTYTQLPKYVAPLVSEVRQIFQFKEHIVDKSQRLLHKASKGEKNVICVGVYVRRTDYK
jgi:hypothetical protein